MQKEKEQMDALMIKCRNILKKEGIAAAEKITGPVVNGRIRSRFGRCTRKGDVYEIEISHYLLECSDKEIETVLLHELLHTCPGCMNHGPKWRNYAARLNRKYGYEISVRTSYESLRLKDPGSREEIKYLVVCRNCGQEFPRRRRCSLVDHTDRYACGKCGGKLEIR